MRDPHQSVLGERTKVSICLVSMESTNVRIPMQTKGVALGRRISQHYYFAAGMWNEECR